MLEVALAHFFGRGLGQRRQRMMLQMFVDEVITACQAAWFLREATDGPALLAAGAAHFIDIQPLARAHPRFAPAIERRLTPFQLGSAKTPGGMLHGVKV